MATMDAGADHSDAIYERVLRTAGDHALLVTAKMSVAERPYVAATLPLSRGSIEPVDLRGLRGVSFDVRGDGDYTLIVPTRAIRSSNFFQAPFSATPQWHSVRIDFATLKQADQRTPAQWTGDDALAVIFRINGKPQEQRWLELDNVRFYK